MGDSKKMTDKVNINIIIQSCKNVKDPIIIIPDDEEHPFTKVVRNDALIIDVDYSKIPNEEDDDDE